MLDHDGYLPCFGVITEGKVHDVRVAQQLRFAPGTIVVDDRGYNDYALFGRWTEQGVFFVTRMKDNALYEVVERARAAPEPQASSRDQIDPAERRRRPGQVSAPAAPGGGRATPTPARSWCS